MYIIKTVSSHARLTPCAPLQIFGGRYCGDAGMTVQALGYVGFGSAALDDWRQFGTGLVGLQAVERSPSLLAFRMDDRKQRIVIDRSMPEGTRFWGGEVAAAAALNALAARRERAGVAVPAEPQTTADNRRVG